MKSDGKYSFRLVAKDGKILARAKTARNLEKIRNREIETFSIEKNVSQRAAQRLRSFIENYDAYVKDMREREETPRTKEELERDEKARLECGETIDRIIERYKKARVMEKADKGLVDADARKLLCDKIMACDDLKLELLSLYKILSVKMDAGGGFLETQIQLTSEEYEKLKGLIEEK